MEGRLEEHGTPSLKSICLLKFICIVVTFVTLHLYLVQLVIHNDFTFRCFVERVNLIVDFREVENRICVRLTAQREFTHHLIKSRTDHNI